MVVSPVLVFIVKLSPINPEPLDLEQARVASNDSNFLRQTSGFGESNTTFLSRDK